MTCLIVIPARWGSTRLPGKPLLSIGDRSMLSWTISAAQQAAQSMQDAAVLVATDDQRIADHARAFGCDAMLTDSSLPSGSDRTLAAAAQMRDLPEFVVNLQGDTPFTPPASLHGIVTALRAGAEVATPVVPLSWSQIDQLREHKALSPFSGTICTVDCGGRALWFSKSLPPVFRGEAQLRAAGSRSPLFRHIGLYGYTMAALRLFATHGPSPLERLEGLEQLRFLDLGISIQTVALEKAPILMSGIDTPTDLAAAEAAIAHGLIEAA